MNENSNRAPLALAIVALFAASLAPLSGAESQTDVYTFRVGSPGDPTWTMLKLNVTRPGIEPSIQYSSSAFRCPAMWGTWFMTGTPEDASVYNGVSFLFGMGRTGADVYVSAFATVHEDEIQEDGAETCKSMNVRVNNGELPVGTVYVLNIAAGVPFVGSARFFVDQPGVEVVGVSSGSTSIFRNETEFGRGVGAVAYSPPFCASSAEDLLVMCARESMMPGGYVGASAQVARRAPLKFEHHPFFTFGYSGNGVTNASIQYPDGHFEYMASPLPEPGPAYALGASMAIHHMGPPPGQYYFHVTAGATAGKGAGWKIAGADIWFPEEVA